MHIPITARFLVAELDQLLDPIHMDDYGPNGLHIANEGHLTKIATSVTSTLEVIEKVVRIGAQALIVHHAFKDAYPINDHFLYKKIHTLMVHNIALIRYHLPLDAHQELGNNWKAARDLGWQNLQPFGHYNGSIIGVRGTFAPVSIETFAASLEKYYGNKAMVAPAKKQISSAALISGGAHKYIVQAAAAGVDCYITGTCDEIAWDVAYEAGISFCSLGHVATEKVGPKALAEYIQKTYKIETEFIDSPNRF